MASSRSSSSWAALLLVAFALCFLAAGVSADDPLLKDLPHLPKLPQGGSPKGEQADADEPPKPKLPGLTPFPSIPKPSLPSLPSFPKPTLPQLPSFPKPSLPSLPQPQGPKLPPSCLHVFNDLRDCVTFVLKPKESSLAPAPIPPSCINAYTALIGASTLSKDNRIASCACVKAVASSLTSALPGSPIPTVGFPLSPNIDCSKIL